MGEISFVVCHLRPELENHVAGGGSDSHDLGILAGSIGNCLSCVKSCIEESMRAYVYDKDLSR